MIKSPILETRDISKCPCIIIRIKLDNACRMLRLPHIALNKIKLCASFAHILSYFFRMNFRRELVGQRVCIFQSMYISRPLIQIEMIF